MSDGVSDMERQANQQQPRQPRLGRDALVASICGFVVVLMVGASYAAVPFYNWFCRVTGFNGTTQIALRTLRLPRSVTTDVSPPM